MANFNYYPKNWNANGYGWVNMQALAYATGEDTKSLGAGSSTSSGVSSLYPSLGAAALSYGFSDSILKPKPVPSIYPTLGFTDDSDISAPPAEERAVVAPKEIPYTAIHVPADQHSYWMEQIFRRSQFVVQPGSKLI